MAVGRNGTFGLSLGTRTGARPLDRDDYTSARGLPIRVISYGDTRASHALAETYSTCHGQDSCFAPVA